MKNSTLTIGQSLGTPEANNIGLMRVLLSALVIYSHSYDLGDFGLDPLERLSGDSVSLGGWAVHAFFVISGYLMAESWSRTGRAVPYLVHRVLRIFPGFWTCLLASSLMLAPLLLWSRTGSLAGYWDTAPSPWGYVWRNAALAIRQTSIGSVAGDQLFAILFNSALWTLGWEFMGYLGVLALGLVRGVRTGSWLILAAFVLFYLNLTCDPTHYRFFFRLYSSLNVVRLPVFFLAGTCFWAFAQGLRPSWWLTVLSLGAMLGGTWLGLYNWVTPLALPCLLFSAACLSGTPPLIARRDYSYGLYLYGFPVQRLLLQWPAATGSLACYALASLVLTLPLAMLSWHGVERRCLNLKKPLSERLAGLLKRRRDA